MKARTKLAAAVCAALSMIPVSQALAGVDFTAGDWKVDISGNINAFYVGTSCDSGANTAVIGGLACTGSDSAAVRNGLLPADIAISGSSRQGDLDVSFTVGLYPGINSSAAAGVNGPGLPAALQTPGIDARQAFFTFGDASWGSFKLGRDIGIFGRDAILSDMTLLSVGGAVNNAAPSNTSLGRIGLGYIYTDFMPQITYSTPNFNGFTAQVGVFQPLDVLAGFATFNKHDSPMIQGGAAYSWGGKDDTVTGKVWADFITQELRSTPDDVAGNAVGASKSFTGDGFDVGVKFNVANFDFVAYGYTGSGIGTTGFFVLPTDALGKERDSEGGYLQATYKFDRVKLGLSYGESRLKLTSGEKALGASNSDLVKRNDATVGGVYYSLTKSITLVGEYTHVETKAFSGNSASEDTYALGGIIFF
jgi:predicted porin